MRATIGGGSADRAQSGAADQGLRRASGVPGEVPRGLGDLVRGGDRLEAFDEGVPVDTLARSITRAPDRAEAGGRGQLRKQRDEPDAQPSPRRLVGRVPAYVPNGGLGAGVSAAERGSAQG